MSKKKERFEDSVDELFFGICKRVDTPKSLGLYLRYRHAPEELARAEIRPEAYHCAATFAADYLCVSLLGKFRSLRTGIDTEKVALDGFASDEIVCRETNERLARHNTSDGVPSVIRQYIERMKQIVESTWGDPSWQQIYAHMGWGPGATASLKGANARTEAKMQFPIEVTPTAAPYLFQALRGDHLWLAKAIGGDVVGPASYLISRDNLVQYTASGRRLTVPKNAKTDRVIIAEPTGNIHLQKGWGGYLKDRLLHCGIDLFEQKRNQELAEHAQRLGLATIDLKSASNSVSTGVVKLLAPPEMYRVLNNLRTPCYTDQDGVEHRLEMFSTMGNGFTFELESLIFYSAAKAVAEINRCGKPLSIYGDDIIVGQEIAEELIRLLNYLGFRVNEDKSFLSGRFFESCGKHYFDGVDVTPVYQKKPVDSRIEHMRFLNRIHTWLTRNADTWDTAIRPVWRTQLQKRGCDLKGWDWMGGDGYYFIEAHENPGLKFIPGRGYVLKYLRGSTKVKLGDRGLYAYKMRQSARRTVVHPVRGNDRSAYFVRSCLSYGPHVFVSGQDQRHFVHSNGKRLATSNRQLALDSAYSDKHESVPCKGFDSVRSKESKVRKRKRVVPVLLRELLIGPNVG